MKSYSTSQVARLLGIDKSTLLRWIYAGQLHEPERVNVGGIKIRIWSKADVECAKKYKLANFRKGRGRKKNPV